MKKEIIIYTDGSSLGNPGKGGWGVIFLANKKVMEMGGFQKEATNNQMELMAILKALEKLAKKEVSAYKIIINSDSKYSISGIEDWISGWKNNGWKTSAKKDVKNRELWERIDSLLSFLKVDNLIKFKYVKAHNGEIYNERVDDIARIMAESEGKKPKLFVGKEGEYEKNIL